MRASTCSIGILFAALGVSPPSSAQSSVRQVEDDDKPYVHLYSACRAHAPDHPLARKYYDLLQGPGDAEDFQEIVQSLLRSPIEQLTAVEGELFFVLLSAIDSKLSLRRPEDSREGQALLREDRKAGPRIAARLASDIFVRCAWLASRTDAAARAEFTVLTEDALSGRVQIEMPAYVLHYGLGHTYLNQGFKLLPHTEHAAPLFEKGARHLLDAALDAQDRRYVDSWTRYAFMLNKLSVSQQRAVSQRLLAYVESTRAEALQTSAQAIRVYLDVLNVAGNAASASEEHKDAVSIYERYVGAVKRLRQQRPKDPNAEVSEALGQVLLGDALAAAGDRTVAEQRYHDAERVLQAASADARQMLEFQRFPQELKTRLVVHDPSR